MPKTELWAALCVERERTKNEKKVKVVGVCKEENWKIRKREVGQKHVGRSTRGV